MFTHQLLTGFIDFIKKQGVVGLAVGVVVAGASSKLVASLVENIINPLIGLVLGSQKDFSTFTIGPIKVGAFMSSVIDFSILMFVVYFVVKLFIEKIVGEEIVKK